MSFAETVRHAWTRNSGREPRMGIVDALDERCLAATARLVVWSMDRGWHDRHALMRDLSAGRAVSASCWTLPIFQHMDSWSSLAGLPAPLLLCVVSALESRRHAKRIGSGDTLEGWRSETVRAASTRSVARRFRLSVLVFAIAMVACAVMLGPAVLLSVPDAPILAGIVYLASLPAYFVLLAARTYVEAADPPPPRTRTATVTSAKAATAAG